MPISPDYGDDWVAFVNYYLKNIWKGSGKPKMALHLLNNTTGSSVKDVANAKAASMGIDIVACRGAYRGYYFRDGKPDPYQGQESGCHFYFQYS